MAAVSTVLFVLFLIPFVGWGIYSLYVRFQREEEFAPIAEAATLTAVVVLLVIELSLLRVPMQSDPLLYIFSALGLLVAAMALYGHMLVSFVSQTAMAFLEPSETDHLDHPDLSNIDALERVGDYEGALAECMVQARIFPSDEGLALRAAQNLVELERFREAAEWFERGLARVGDPERGLRIANRVVEIYSRELLEPHAAVRTLELYLERFEDSERTHSVRQRLERLRRPARDEAIVITESLVIPPADPSV